MQSSLRLKSYAQRVDESMKLDDQVLQRLSALDKIGAYFASTSSRTLMKSSSQTSISRIHDPFFEIRECDIRSVFRQIFGSFSSFFSHDSSSLSSSFHVTSIFSHSTLSSIFSFSMSSEFLTLSTPSFNLADLAALSLTNRIWGEGYLRFDWTLSQVTSFVVESVLKRLKKRVDIKFSSILIEDIISSF